MPAGSLRPVATPDLPAGRVKEILLAVEESKIALTPDGIQLQVGESTVIRLSKDGITIVGGSVFIN
ncbi:type VI secretion protein [Escherichia coli]|nr:type VI secretion protein [Escherichia coli]